MNANTPLKNVSKVEVTDRKVFGRFPERKHKATHFSKPKVIKKDIK